LSRDSRNLGTPSGSSAAASVWAGDDLQNVPAGIIPIHPAASVVCVELTWPAFEWVGPVRQVAFLDPAEYLIEFRLTDQEGIVLRMWRTVVVGEVKRNIICDLHHQKRAKGRRFRQAEDLRQEGCRLPLVPYPDNRVVQLHAHLVDATGYSLFSREGATGAVRSVVAFAQKFTLDARKRPDTPGEGTAGVSFQCFAVP